MTISALFLSSVCCLHFLEQKIYFEPSRDDFYEELELEVRKVAEKLHVRTGILFASR